MQVCTCLLKGEREDGYIKTVFKKTRYVCRNGSSAIVPTYFLCVWLTAYDGVNERADQMRIAIVNEDVNIGNKIAEGLQRNLPFQVKAERSVEKANKEMNDHVYDMIVKFLLLFQKI